MLTKTERRAVGASFIVSAFGLFDLADPDPDRLQGDQAMWMMAAKELPPGAVFDLGMPKPTAEVLVAGHAAAPGGAPVQRMGLAWAIGNLQKQLLVTGDRVWRMAGATALPTEPVPFVQMPLTPARCFGGEGHAANPTGTGFRAQERLMARETVALPNIEVPELAVRSIGDAPAPPRFGPVAVDARERLQYAGTYDDHWIKNLAPALADDADPRLFLFAPPDQRLPGYLAGDEGYGLRNFAADAPEVQRHLPGFRVRCFIGWTDPQKPMVELPMRIDTLWLFAGARRGVMVYRSATPVEDIEAADVADVMLAYERMTDEPRPLSHYLQVRALRTNPETAYKYAFAEHQLAPALPQDVLDARNAKRRALAQERRSKRRDDAEWMARQELARSGVPKELWPAIEIPEFEDDDVPMPLPEEIAGGEVDFAEMLDALEALQAKAEAKLDEVARQQHPALAAMQEIASGQAEPGAIDQLLAMLDMPEVAGQIDAEIAKLPGPGELPAVAEASAPEMEAKLDSLGNWRKAMLDAADPEVDEAAQLALARARFLGLPEGRPLEHVRRELSGDRLALPDLPDLPDTAIPPQAETASESSLEEALRILETTPYAPVEAAEQLRAAMDEVDAKLGAALPNLAGEGGSPLAILAAVPASSAPRPATTRAALDDAAAQVAQGRAEVEAGLDQAEAQMAGPVLEMRRLSPQPLKPDTPLTPAVAQAFGALVAEQYRAGIVLAGRDLAGADLSGIDLSGADLSGALLENARLDGARLTGANLARATLCGASLVQADLSGCDLSEANLCQVDARGARFEGSRIIEASLFGAQFAQAVFDQAELRNLTLMTVPFTAASFRGARLSDSVFMRTDLSGTNWQGAALERVHFMDVDCPRIVMAGAQLFEVGFVMARAAGADFSDATLTSVLFAGEADLRQASFARVRTEKLAFQKADLSDSDFGKGRLDGACFVETVLARANFREGSLKRALLSRNDLTGIDFFAANLLEAQLNRADLRGASLRAANLFGADLADAALLGADFSRANLGRTLLAVASDG
ncbi:DUF2169 family type VI secretion system accessory protein [Bosea caraganae]|uniref:DUF2169 family type VI secretion system accessory protein n=1 Tax=Bosea caraganae TaxID=2763117 RepID=UPI0015F07F72|nr:DUF2169 domain-containing protein [Bosea caraganae]